MHTLLTVGPEYLEELAVKVENFEGRVHWLYLDGDPPGNVAVGIGFLLSGVWAAQQMPFRLEDGTRATQDEIEADFHKVEAMEPYHFPSYYLTQYSVRLQDLDIEQLLLGELQDCDQWFRQHFSQFEAWPRSAKLAALDMRYDLGPAKFFTYPILIRALFACDWLTAAKESGRNISTPAFDDRNDWTRCGFLDAATFASEAAAAAAHAGEVT